jgi:DNA modification methylase
LRFTLICGKSLFQVSAFVQTTFLEQIPVVDLVPCATNPRLHPEPNVAKLMQSIEVYGWTTPILVSDSLEVIAGHGRLLAAQKLGIQIVPCIRLKHLTPALVKAYRIADNRLTIDSDWDEELLSSVMADLHSDPGFDLALTGFDPEEIGDFLGYSDPQAGEDDAPTVQEVAVSRLGDIWELDKHRVVCGDCTDADVVSAVLHGASPNLMVTDPPYGVGYDAEWRDGHDRDIGAGALRSSRALGKVINDDRVDWTDAWTLFLGGIVYCWHAGVHAACVQQSLEAVGFTIRSQVIWVKQHFVFGRGDYHWQHEPCWYAVRKTGHWTGDRKQTTVWEINNNNPFGGEGEEKLGHSTQKPVEVMRRPIVNHTVPGDSVYDPFMGSGTTLIAAETTHRVAYGVEIEPTYIDMAVRRWQTFTGRVARLSGDGRTFEEIQDGRLEKV